MWLSRPRLATVVVALLFSFVCGACRTKCCHGCGGYYCKRANCGTSCRMGPRC